MNYVELITSIEARDPCAGSYPGVYSMTSTKLYHTVRRGTYDIVNRTAATFSMSAIDHLMDGFLP